MVISFGELNTSRIRKVNNMPKYTGMDDHAILILLADSTDRQERRLSSINGSLSNHEKRLMRMEIRREVEEDIGLRPVSRKRKIAEGSMYSSGITLIAGSVYALGRLVGWW